MSTELTKEQIKEQINQEWIDDVNSKAESIANELSQLFDCEVKPFVFVVEPLKDAAIGYLKVPDAKQSLKIFRTMVQDVDSGAELAAKAQLIRKVDVESLGFTGEASDERLMDINGVYNKKYSSLNMSLLLRAQRIIEIFSDQFKKK